MTKRAKSSPRKSPGRATAAPKVRKDPLREFDEVMRKDGVDMVGLLDDGNLSNVKASVSTGSMALDALLNGQGIPCGRITEIYGPQHVGKTTLLDQVFANVQRMGGFGVLIDTEAARDNVYVRALGVDADRLRMLQFEDPNQVTIENVCNRIRDTVRWWSTEMPQTPVVIGWDSLGNTTTRSEMDKDIGERTVGSAAKALRDAMRKLVQLLAHSRVALVIINHQYSNIPTGPVRVTARETYGGQAVRLAASLRLELFNKGIIKRNDGAVVGRQVGCRLDKNRFGFCRDTDIAVMTGHGISNTWTLFETLGDAGIISKSGSWATYQSPELGPIKFQGWAGLEAIVKEKPEVFTEMCCTYNEVMKHAAL